MGKASNGIGIKREPEWKTGSGMENAGQNGKRGPGQFRDGVPPPEEVKRGLSLKEEFSEFMGERSSQDRDFVERRLGRRTFVG